MTIKHLFPPAWPALNLDFANSKALDPRITFTRSSTGTYVDADSIVRTAVDDEPRFDHDPSTGESLGLLIEESRTNTVLHSSDLTAASWNTPTNSSLSAGDTAPDGTTTSNRLTEDSSAIDENHALNVTVANLSGGASPGVDITISFWAKSSNRGIRARALAWSNWNFYFDIANLSGNRDAQIASGNLIPFPNGWYKCIYTGNVQGNRRLSLQMSISDEDYPGDGTSYVDLFGIQTEVGSFPTSYVPTAGATATRAVDIAQMTGTNFSSWYNTAESTWYAEGDQLKISVDGNQLGVSSLFVDRYADISPQRWREDSWRGKQYSATIINPFTTPVTPKGSTVKTTYAVDGTNGKMCVEGVLSPTGTLVAYRQATELRLGKSDRLVANDDWNGHISRIAYYPTRLPDEQLQALTS